MKYRIVYLLMLVLLCANQMRSQVSIGITLGVNTYNLPQSGEYSYNDTYYFDANAYITYSGNGTYDAGFTKLYFNLPVYILFKNHMGFQTGLSFSVCRLQLEGIYQDGTNGDPGQPQSYTSHEDWTNVGIPCLFTYTVPVSKWSFMAAIGVEPNFNNSGFFASANGEVSALFHLARASSLIMGFMYTHPLLSDYNFWTSYSYSHSEFIQVQGYCFSVYTGVLFDLSQVGRYAGKRIPATDYLKMQQKKKQ